MEEIFQKIYDFCSNNIVVVSTCAALGVGATILEKSSKIATPIQTMVKKRKDKKEAQKKRDQEMYDNIQSILAKIEEIQNKEIHPLEEKVEEIDHIVGHPETPWQDVFKETADHLVKIDEKLDKLGDRILENEADRLRDVLFNCGNACRRGEHLDGEDFRHIQTVYTKYRSLGQNGIGEQEMNFITEYYNSQDFS